MDLTTQILQSNIKHNLIRRGDTVVAAVSGGADSVVLLHILYQGRLKLGLRLYVAHFNHRTRLSADHDEIFVKNLAARLNLPFLVGRRRGKIQPLSEDKARQLRQKFLLDTAYKVKAQSVAMAHHQDDLAETVLMRIIRGTGLYGLRGIQRESKIDNQRFIRPLLSVSKGQIEKYVKSHGLEYCQDETNEQTDYLRNKIRLKVLPELTKNYNPNFHQSLIDLADIAQCDYEYLLLEAQKIFKKHANVAKEKIQIKLSSFIKLHLSMRRLILRLAFENLASNLNQLNFSHIKDVEELIFKGSEGGSVHWPQSIKVTKFKKDLIITVG